MGLFESNYYVACTKKALLQSFELNLEFVKPMLGVSRTSEVLNVVGYYIVIVVT